jgi:group I intron endonuclease
MIGIYKITSPTKKIYIGQSVNIEKRILSYKGLHCKNQTIIYNSLKKYGVDKHKFEILCECEISELNDKERYYQDLYSAIGIF